MLLKKWFFVILLNVGVLLISGVVGHGLLIERGLLPTNFHSRLQAQTYSVSIPVVENVIYNVRAEEEFSVFSTYCTLGTVGFSVNGALAAKVDSLRSNVSCSDTRSDIYVFAESYPSGVTTLFYTDPNAALDHYPTEFLSTGPFIVQIQPIWTWFEWLLFVVLVVLWIVLLITGNRLLWESI